MPDDPSLPRKTVAHNVVHLRREPTNGSELVSQTLMGRSVLIHETRGAWSYVETDDTYRGWAENRWLVDPSDRPLTAIGAIFADMRSAPRGDASLIVRLPILAAVHADPLRQDPGDCIAATLPDGTEGWLAPGVFSSYLALHVIHTHKAGWLAAQRAREFLGTPYLWGGSSAFGLDCSGLVQLCYRLTGIVLRRDADIQRSDPRFVPVGFDALQPGDLVFFGKEDRITHVGMHLDSGRFIHSAGSAGVIISEWGDERYSPAYVDARRLDPAKATAPVTRPEEQP